MDHLLRYLSENDPNRYGTPPPPRQRPPACKEAIEAMPTVIVKDSLQCSICLEDIEVGNEAKQMPCKHKFHDVCIIPWLEIRSSCPICRFQLPLDDPIEPNVDVMGTGRRYWIPIQWPYDGLLALQGSQSEPTQGSENASRRDEN